MGVQGSRRSADRSQLSYLHSPSAPACLVCFASWTVPADGDAAAAPTGRRTRWGWFIARNSERYPQPIAHCPHPAPCHFAIANIPPTMSSGGPGHFQEPSALYSFSPLEDSLSNALAGSIHQKGNRLPTIQPASPPNKGAPHSATTPNRAALFPIARGHPHATAIASSGSSTTESLSELTSSSSRDSLPTPPGRNGPTTPQKQARNNRRKPSNKSSGRWSRGGGSSDDTGSDRKPPTSQPAEPAQSAAQSPQSASKTRQRPYIATNNASTTQTRFMATAFGGPSGDSRRGVVSPRPKGRGMTMPHVHVPASSLTGPHRSEEHSLPQCHHLRTLSVRE